MDYDKVTYDRRYRPRPDDPLFDREDYDPVLAARVRALDEAEGAAGPGGAPGADPARSAPPPDA